MPWSLPRANADRLSLAKGYPYEAPASSYLFRAGAMEAPTERNWHPEIFEERHPVIAHGSNRSPEQLKRKFREGKGAAALHGDDRIPVTRARLQDYDVVYSAHITRYGAVAANLQRSPGAAVELFVTWLTDRQLAWMHETELGGENYQFGHLRDVRVDLDAGPSAQLTHVGAYLSRHGCLRHEDRPAGLAAIPAEQRRYRAVTQVEALTTVRDRHHPGLDVDVLILSAIEDQGFRRALIAEMRAEAIPLEAPHFTALSS